MTDMTGQSAEIPLDVRDDPPAPILVHDPVLDILETGEQRRIRELEAEVKKLKHELTQARAQISDQGWELEARREAYVPSTDGWTR